MTAYSYETPDGQVYHASDLDSVLKQCKFLAEIATTLGPEYAQQLLDLSRPQQEVEQQKLEDKSERQESKESKEHKINQSINLEPDIKPPSEVVFNHPIINEYQEPLVIDHQSEISKDRVDHKVDLPSSLPIRKLNVFQEKPSLVTEKTFSEVSETIEAPPKFKPEEAVIEFRDHFDRIVEFEEVEVLVDHSVELPLDVTNNHSLLDQEENYDQVFESESSEIDWSLLESELEAMDLDEAIHNEMEEDSDLEYPSLIRFNQDDDLTIEEQNLSDSIERDELIVPDDEIELVIELLEAFDDQLKDNIFTEQITDENLAIIYQQTIDYELLKSFDVVESKYHHNEEQLQDTLISLFQAIDNDQLELDPDLKKPFLIIEQIINTYNQDPVINQVIIKKIYKLLYDLGYENPRQYIIDFIAQYGFDFLIKNLSFLLANFQNKIRNIEKNIKLKTDFTSSNHQTILDFIFELLKIVDLGFSGTLFNPVFG